MSDNSINKKIYGGCAILALQNLGYENIIHDFWIEFESVVEHRNQDSIFKFIDKFLDDNQKQIVFEGIKIPENYNSVKIRDLFEKHDFVDEKVKSICKRVCNAFRNSSIIYIKDLYNKSRDELLNIRNVGIYSYEFFVQALKEIFRSEI